MFNNRILRAFILIYIVVFGTILPNVIYTPPASAASPGATTFYFHKYDYGFFSGSIDQQFPQASNGSALPPIIPDLSNNTDLPINEDYIFWISTWFALEFIGELDNETGNGFDDIFKNLFNPFRIKETYIYQGDETQEIEGDAFFKLFFTTIHKRWLKKYQDQFEVKIFHEGNIIGNKTITVIPGIFEGRVLKREFMETVKISNLDFDLQPGDSLSFSCELLPSQKILSNISKFTFEGTPFITLLIDRLPGFLKNRTLIPKFQAIGEFLDEIKNITTELNISREELINDLGKVIHTALPIHFRFHYDSHQYPSSVTLPGMINTENIRTYYLTNNGLQEDMPNGTKNAIKLSNSQNWQTEPLDRNKIIILDNISACIYLSTLTPFKLLPRNQITLQLLNNNETLAETTYSLEGNSLGNILLSFRDYLLGPRTPTVITFSGEEQEILNGENITLRIKPTTPVKNLQIIRKIFPPKIFYNSLEYPSNLQLRYRETDNIHLNVSSNPTDEQIVPGDSIVYKLSMDSKYNDTITIDTTIIEENGDWDISITPQEIRIRSGSTGTSTITISSTDNTKEAYDSYLMFTIIAKGKTGLDTYSSITEITENAIEYNVSIPSYTETKKIKKGTNGTFYFIIKNDNTGAVDDTDTYSITVTSKNNWPLLYNEKYRNLEKGSSTGSKDIPVIVSVPKNTSMKRDVLSFTVTSDGSNGQVSTSVNVTIEVLSLSLFETIYEFFDSASKTIGLKEPLGDYAAVGLASILLIVILFIIIILALILTKKLFTIYCTQPIQQIDPNDQAVFTINIRNHSKKPQTFTINSSKHNPLIKWDTTIRPSTISIPGTSSDTVTVIVKPTPDIQPNDWAEIPINVSLKNKRKTVRLSTMVSVREGKPILQIKDAFTWPKDFSKGDRIITSFKLTNIGTLSARNVKVLFYINGKQKNKIVTTIPSGGYADIKIPWSAVKGKNKLLIKAVEKKQH